jgi:hypothetical protein
VLSARFAASLRSLGIERPIDLGSMRGSSSAFDGLAPAVEQAARAGLAWAFHLSFAVCAVVMVMAVCVVAGLNDVPLRSAGEPAAIGH